MNNLIYVRNTSDFPTIFNLLKNNTDIKINGVYESKKKFSDEHNDWFDIGKFISITTKTKYDDLSNIFMLNNNSNLTSSANYLNVLLNMNPKLINFDETKNFSFFNNPDFAKFTKFNDLNETEPVPFKYDENKDVEKKIAYCIADLYSYSDQNYATSFFNDKLHSNRNYACNYLKKVFREKGVDIINKNLDLLLTLNLDNPNNSELEEKIQFVKFNLNEINKLYDKSTLGKIKNLISELENDGLKDFLPKDQYEMIQNAENDSKEFKIIYNRLMNIKEIEKKKAEIVNKQAFGKSAKEILQNVKYAEIKEKRREIFGTDKIFSPDEYSGLIPEWLITKLKKSLSNESNSFKKIKADYYNSFFEKADRELNKRYDLLDYIENTPVMTLSVHTGKKSDQSENTSQYDWTNPNTLKNYKNNEAYIDKVPFVFQDLKRFVGYKLEWISSGKDWKDEFGLDVENSHGKSIKKPLFDNEGNIMVDDNGFPIFEGKFAKIPYSCLTGKKTGSDREAEWCNYKQAIEGIRKYNLHGLGIELGGEGNDKIIGLDIDHIIDEEGNYTFEAHDVVSKLQGNSWIEKSISGTGLHAIVKGNFVVPNNQKRVNNFEMYDSDRFFTISGLSINLTVQNNNDGIKALREIHQKYMQKQVGSKFNNNNLEKGELVQIEYPEGQEQWDIDTILNRCITSWERRKEQNYNTNKFEEIYNGNYEGYFASGEGQSPADYWLINQVRFFGATKKQADEIMRSSALMRDKWNRSTGKSGDTYGSVTINQVYDSNTTVYNPSYKKDSNKKIIEKRS